MIGLVLCLPSAFIHDVSAFVYFGGICVCIILVSLSVISGFMIQGIAHHGPSSDYTLHNWSKFPEFFGIACFSLEGIGLIFPIRGSLKEPKKFLTTFNAIAAFWSGLYIVFGILCHVALGSLTKEVIFYNFPKSFTSIYIFQFAYALGIFITFPVFTQTTVNIIKRIDCAQKFFEGNKNYRNSCILRAVAIVFFFMICMTGVNIVDIMDFAGAICNCYLSFVLPILAYVVYFESQGLLSKKSKYLHFTLMAVGVICSLTSVIFAVYDIFQRKHAHGHKASEHAYSFFE